MGTGKGKKTCSYTDYVCLYACTIRICTLCSLMLMLCAVYLPVYKVHLLLLSSYKLEKTRELGRCTFPAGPLSVTIAPWLALRDIASPGNKSPFLKRAGMGKKIYIYWNENGLLLASPRSWEELHLKCELSLK